MEHRVKPSPAMSVSQTATRGQEWLRQLCRMRWCLITHVCRLVCWICVSSLLSLAQCLWLTRSHPWHKFPSTLWHLWIITSVGHNCWAFICPAALCRQKWWRRIETFIIDKDHLDGINQPGVMQLGDGHSSVHKHLMHGYSACPCLPIRITSNFKESDLPHSVTMHLCKCSFFSLVTFVSMTVCKTCCWLIFVLAMQVPLSIDVCLSAYLMLWSWVTYIKFCFWISMKSCSEIHDSQRKNPTAISES